MARKRIIFKKANQFLNIHIKFKLFKYCYHSIKRIKNKNTTHHLHKI
jgi:hypothetical protein